MRKNLLFFSCTTGKKWLFFSCMMLFLICETDFILAETLENGTVGIEQDSVQQLDWKEDISRGVLQAGGLLDKDACPKSGSVLQIQAKESQIEDVLLKALKTHAEKVDLRSYNIKAVKFSTIFSAFMNSHPELFYVDAFHSLPYYDIKTGKMTTIYFRYFWNESECVKKIEEFNAAVNLALKNVDSQWSDVEKALYLNDYLCENITYDDTYSYYDAYHGLVEGTTVCQGYSLAYMMLAQKIGLSTQMVTSVSLDHAWNMVKIDGKYYHVDATWNDNEYENGSSSHFYFLKSTDYFKKDFVGSETGHNADDYVIQGDWLPEYASYTDFDDRPVWDLVHSTFNYIDGIWYTYDQTNGYILSYVCQGDEFELVDQKELASYLTPSGRTVYFSSVGEYGGRLYYSHGREGIYEWNPESDEEVLVYEYPEELKANDGYMIYLNVDAYGKISFLYFDGTYVREKKNVICVDKKKYKITYQLYGGKLSNTAPKTYSTGTSTFQLKKPTRSGYKFEGWYLDKKYKTKIIYIAKGSFGNKKLYAKWSKK